VLSIGGGELFDRVIEDEFVLSELACCIFMKQILEGVNYIHTHNIIHLDLKVIILDWANDIHALHHQPGLQGKDPLEEVNYIHTHNIIHLNLKIMNLDGVNDI
jgi:hypothetical protein